jgi:AraC-like DNA-binding protein
VQTSEVNETVSWDSVTLHLRQGATERRYAPGALTVSGLETRRQSEARYHWDGMRRGADPAHPFVLFQVTLGGQGAYEDRRGGKERLTVGRAFIVVIPSAHRYYLPEESPDWTFFWLILRHPYLARRIGERQQRVGAAATVLDLQSGSPLMQEIIALLADRAADPFAEEAAVFRFLIEYERHVHAASSTPARDSDASGMLLETLRDRVLTDLTHPVSVEEVAKGEGMSRTRYSHYFKVNTGISPAAFMTQVRLEEVARRLAQTDVTLAALARETGFADANHLCKVFRRHYHLSPGTFRQQMR